MDAFEEIIQGGIIMYVYNYVPVFKPLIFAHSIQTHYKNPQEIRSEAYVESYPYTI